MAVECLSAGILVADHLCAPIARLPAAGELVLADELPLSLGGCAANVAMDLARIETKVGILGCVGEDPFGAFLADTLEQQGVDVSGIRHVEGVGTSGTLIINVQGEDRRFIHTLGANAVFSTRDISLDAVRQARVLYVGGYLLMDALRPDALAEIFGQARSAGVKTVLDIVLPSPESHWAKLEPVLGETDVFLPNEDEAAVITGLKDPIEQAQVFRRAGAKTVVITCGESGAVLVDENCKLQAAAYGTDYVGGTGAGDAFDAGYIAGLLEGADPRGCLQWGSALGASCVRSVSATESVFTRHQAEAFLANRELSIRTL